MACMNISILLQALRKKEIKGEHRDDVAVSLCTHFPSFGYIDTALWTFIMRRLQSNVVQHLGIS
jgi:hypothetical protein